MQENEKKITQDANCNNGSDYFMSLKKAEKFVVHAQFVSAKVSKTNEISKFYLLLVIVLMCSLRM